MYDYGIINDDLNEIVHDKIESYFDDKLNDELSDGVNRKVYIPFSHPNTSKEYQKMIDKMKKAEEDKRKEIDSIRRNYIHGLLDLENLNESTLRDLVIGIYKYLLISDICDIEVVPIFRDKSGKFYKLIQMTDSEAIDYLNNQEWRSYQGGK